MVPQVAIIVPVLNEADNIEPFVEELSRSLTNYDWEVIFADDKSNDGTQEAIGRLAVIGSRYMQGGDTGEWSKRRKRCSRAATLASQFVLGRKEIADPMSGYFMVERALFLANVQGLCGKDLNYYWICCRQPRIAFGRLKFPTVLEPG
jgi:cellulose synthase/poly-beta-1,6-N-acetylglucosamine synthase-like glycosyltransferase